MRKATVSLWSCLSFSHVCPSLMSVLLSCLSFSSFSHACPSLPSLMSVLLSCLSFSHVCPLMSVLLSCLSSHVCPSLMSVLLFLLSCLSFSHVCPSLMSVLLFLLSCLSFCHVCPSLTSVLLSTWTTRVPRKGIFLIGCLTFFSIICRENSKLCVKTIFLRKFKLHSKSDQTNWHLIWTSPCIYDKISPNSYYNEKFCKKFCRENQNTHFTPNNPFFSKNRYVY